MLSDEKLQEYHRFKDHQAKTRSQIRGALRKWRRLELGEPNSDAFAIYRDKRLAEGAASATVKGEMNKLLGIARWLGHSPIVKLPKGVQRTPEAWNRTQLRALFRAARKSNRVVWGIPGNVYWPAILGVCYDSGERIGAVLGLRESDIDVGSRRLLYRAEIRKGGYRDSSCQISRSTAGHVQRLLLQRVREHHGGGDAPVFLHGCPSGLWKAYGRLLLDAGLPADRRSKFHRLRRTHATFVHKAGGDATAALGHADPSTTWKYYIDPRQLVRRLPWHPWFGW